jgi:hypothetical protein
MKISFYGESPTETQRAVAETRRIINNWKALEDAFPSGFGSMAREIRSWIGK